MFALNLTVTIESGNRNMALQSHFLSYGSHNLFRDSFQAEIYICRLPLNSNSKLAVHVVSDASIGYRD
jgi:hypothetical protein